MDVSTCRISVNNHTEKWIVMFMPELKIFLLLLLMDEFGNRQEFENVYDLILKVTFKYIVIELFLTVELICKSIYLKHNLN